MISDANLKTNGEWNNADRQRLMIELVESRLGKLTSQDSDELTNAIRRVDALQRRGVDLVEMVNL